MCCCTVPFALPVCCRENQLEVQQPMRTAPQTSQRESRLQGKDLERPTVMGRKAHHFYPGLSSLPVKQRPSVCLQKGWQGKLYYQLETWRSPIRSRQRRAKDANYYYRRNSQLQNQCVSLAFENEHCCKREQSWKKTAVRRAFPSHQLPVVKNCFFSAFSIYNLGWILWEKKYHLLSILHRHNLWHSENSASLLDGKHSCSGSPVPCATCRIVSLQTQCLRKRP